MTNNPPNVKPAPLAPTTEQLCWQCHGSGVCNCVACRKNHEVRGVCVVCKGTGKLAVSGGAGK